MHRTVAALASLALLADCTSDPFSEAQVGSIAAGAPIAEREQRARGAAIGAGVGVLANGTVGGYMDYQEKKLRERLANTGVSVKRVGDDIYLNVPGNLAFVTDSAEVRSDFTDSLDSIVLVLNEFTKTLIEITGHTDPTGGAAHNQQLSEQRAQSVADYFASRQVVPERMISEGIGERSPIASNDTAEGRQQNRRVELRLVPIRA